MSTRPNNNRFLASVRGRLSFANLTALLALFVALGGSSYAALRVGSEQIANNSVRSTDLRNNGVRGRDIHKDTVRGTDVRDGDLKSRDVRDNTLTGNDVKESALGMVARAQDAQTVTGKPASAFLGSDKQHRTGLIKLAHGQNRTVASNGPFTWNAACVDVAGDTRLTVTAESTEPNSEAATFDGGGGAPISPGAPATVFDATVPASDSFYSIAFPLAAVAPSGAAPLGLGFVGFHVAGADCVVNGILWP